MFWDRKLSCSKTKNCSIKIRRNIRKGKIVRIEAKFDKEHFVEVNFSRWNFFRSISPRAEQFSETKISKKICEKQAKMPDKTGQTSALRRENGEIRQKGKNRMYRMFSSRRFCEIRQNGLCDFSVIHLCCAGEDICCRNGCCLLCVLLLFVFDQTKNSIHPASSQERAAPPSYW